MVSIEALARPTPAAPEQYYSSGLRKLYQLDAAKLQAPKHEGPYADIGYEFDEAKYFKRSTALARAVDRQAKLPRLFPASVQGPLVWDGADFPDETSFVYVLTDADKAEINAALKAYVATGRKPEEVKPDTFPLPVLSARLDEIRSDVYEGKGFAILRGLDVDSYSTDELATVYLGLTGYVADIRGKQDQRGSMIMHVLNKDSGDAAVNKNIEKPFHTDTVCDVLCLLTRSCAAEGGRSIMSSVWTVYNELAATRPDIIATLAQPDWPFDTNGRSPPYYNRALLFVERGKVIMNVSRRLLTGNEGTEPRTKGIPGLTEAQAEALDAVHYIARKHEIRTAMKKGDIRFLNNMGILHRREAFEDDGTTKRHLMRLWLHNKKLCWKLPPPLVLAWARIFEDVERPEHWDLEPVRRNGIYLRVSSSCD